MKKRSLSRLLAALLLVGMLVSLLPVSALAAGEDEWVSVAFADITDDDTVAVTMTKGDTTWILPNSTTESGKPPVATTVTLKDGVITGVSAAAYGWSCKADPDTEGGRVFTGPNGTLLCTDANNGIRIGEGKTVWTLNNGYLTTPFASKTRQLGVYIKDGNGQDWRGYNPKDDGSAHTNIAGQTLAFWKLKASTTPEPTTNTIAEALAGEANAEFTVKGVVTLVDGKNIYVQDSTGAICLYFGTAPTDISLGDTLVATGKRATYKGLPELSGATYEKSSGLTLTAKETTLAALTDADICTYVTIKNLTVDSIDGNNTNVKDADGNTLPIFKPVLGDKTLAVGDVIDFTGAVGIFNTKQLRNTVADEIKIHGAYSTIAEALAGEANAEFTVKGVVTLVDGKNIFVQDSTGGICLYFGTAPTDIALGDTLVGTGKRATYKGLPELSGATYEKSEGLTLTAKETTLAALTDADICTYITIKNLTVDSIDGQNTNVKDADGNTLPIYKAVLGDKTLAVGDVIDFTGAVGIFNTKQLRNTVADEIEIHAPYSTIAEALAGEANAEFTVKGVVTLVDGKNIFVQDSTGGICLYFGTAPTDIALGDTLIGTGKRATYKGLPELSGATYEKSEGLTLTAKETTLAALTDADICTYVTIKNLTVDSIDGNNTNVKDTDGNTLPIYKAVLGELTLAAGDVIDFTGAVGIFNTMQLRNTVAGEIKMHEPEATYDTIADALAGEANAEFTVKGVVTLVDGKNIYIQDSTGGICLYFGTAPTDIARGDTLVGTGTRDTYRGLPELKNATYEKSSGLTLTAKETTLGALTEADICTFVTIKDLTVDSIDGSNTVVKDAEGKTMPIYKAVLGDKTLAVGDVIDFTGAVGMFNTMQLRNMEADDIVIHGAAAPGPLAELVEGAKVVIYNPNSGTAINADSSGDYRLKATAVTVTEGKVTDATEDLIWTIGKQGEAWTFTNGSRVISAWLNESNGKQYVELTVNPSYNENTASGWTVVTCSAENNTFYVYSSTLETDKGHCYIEAWTYNSEPVFSGYSVSEDKLGEEAYGLQFIPAEAVETPETVIADGAEVVIYNASDSKSIGFEPEMGEGSLAAIKTEIADGKALPENGAYVFTVKVEGETYVFQNGGKYLATNDSEALFLAETLDDYARWTLTKRGDGYIIYNKAAKYNGNPVCIEYFSDKFSGWTFKAADAAIFLFNFYPLGEGVEVREGIVQAPQVVFDCEDSRCVGQDYTGRFTLDDLAESISELKMTFTAGDKSGEVALTVEGKTATFTIAAADIDGETPAEKLILTVEAKNSYEISYTGTKEVSNLDEPFFGAFTPASNAQTGADKRPVISIEIGNVGEEPTVTMTLNGEKVEAVFAEGVLSYTPAADLADGRVNVHVEVMRKDGVRAEKNWHFTVGAATYQLYFGQLHSHTAEYSDGQGTLKSALDYVASLPVSANVQFVAFTDHSNYFDTTSAANPKEALHDKSKMTADSAAKWNTYKETVAAFNESQGDVVAIAGFEMTWSGGPGHINTFNSDGLVSRNNSELNNKTGDAGMKLYYSTLSQAEGANTISQFNHPGTTFGTFSDFSYWDPVTDSRIFLVEVGNGEGAIGAGGYYPSYEQYTIALDKGWHVAPTNNQDNHKGRWGNANDARDVILTNDFSEQGIYDAIRAMRVYATEDKNLSIFYTLNGEQMGTIFSEENKPEQVNIRVLVDDPDSRDSISKVEVIVNSGKVAYTWNDPTELAKGELTVTLEPTYTYYYIKVTEGDGDLAVTAPVWIGESLKLGISEFTSSVDTPVTNEELTLNATFFNSESKDATIKSLVYTTQGSVILGSDTETRTLAAGSTLTVGFPFTPTEAKLTKVTVTAVIELDGEEYTYTAEVELDVKDADSLVYIGVDASHYNEYVAGNYKDSMGNFGALAAEYGVRLVMLRTSEELVSAAANEKFVALIFTAPSRRLSAAQTNPGVYSAEELAAVKAFNEKGGMVIVAGWSDHYENFPVILNNAEIKHMAETQNELLAALGSSARLGDDGVLDNEYNGGQSQRLYLSGYNFDSFLLDRVEYDAEHAHDKLYTELYSNYGGCSVYFVSGEAQTAEIPGTATPVVYGFATTTIADQDGDGKTVGIPYPVGEAENRALVMATEQLEGKGLIVVSGAAFMSNFEVQAQASDNGSEKNYSNYKICENLLNALNPVQVTPIAEVYKTTIEKGEGYKFTIEGVVTSNASGYDKDTAFFDCIYVQDETGGICCFPVAGVYKVGDRVRITGSTDSYQGEPELQVTSIELLGDATPVEPTTITAAQLNERSVEGSLVTISGTIEEIEKSSEGVVENIFVKDAEGKTARVFIDGYITSAKEIADCVVGAQITATGLASFDNTYGTDEARFPRIRVRDRDDIVCTAPAEEEKPAKPTSDTKSGTVEAGTVVTFTTDTEGADIYYSTDGGKTWTKGDTLTVDKTMTVRVKSVKGDKESGVVAYTFTVPEVDKSVTITLDPCGGTMKDADKKVKTDKEGKIESLPKAEPKTVDVVFGGWYTEKDGGLRVLAGDVLTEDTTLYARWFEYRVVVTEGLVYSDELKAVLKTIPTVEKLQESMLQTAKTKMAAGKSIKGQAYYNLVIEYYDGTSWFPLEYENFPAKGILVTMNVPSKAPNNGTFYALHIIGSGPKIGRGETPTVTKTRDNKQLMFTVTGASPLMIFWIVGAGTGGTGKASGDPAATGLWVALMCASAAALAVVLIYRKKKIRS
ncbi:MAG: CehA/McbA family metallohydrolase [Oscillospiraceae bacterium]|nr:CehA/McbA family metallohydrolase [Oscillospiraceae bacterium]